MRIPKGSRKLPYRELPAGTLTETQLQAEYDEMIEQKRKLTSRLAREVKKLDGPPTTEMFDTRTCILVLQMKLEVMEELYYWIGR